MGGVCIVLVSSVSNARPTDRGGITVSAMTTHGSRALGHAVFLHIILLTKCLQETSKAYA